MSDWLFRFLAFVDRVVPDVPRFGMHPSVFGGWVVLVSTLICSLTVDDPMLGTLVGFFALVLTHEVLQP